MKYYFLRRIIKDHTVSYLQLRLYLLLKLMMECPIRISNSRLAKILNVPSFQIKRALKKLSEKGYIINHPLWYEVGKNHLRRTNRIVVL